MNVNPDGQIVVFVGMRRHYAIPCTVCGRRVNTLMIGGLRGVNKATHLGGTFCVTRSHGH